ncbi:MAG: fumarate hydratase [Candidatus Bathyarchaeia archaeon]
MKAAVVEEAAFNLLKQAVLYLPEDVKKALKRAYEEESSEVGKTQLGAILQNVALAEKFQAPICQDTGLIFFYVKAGANTPNLSVIEEALVKATKKATREIPLRPNAVDPITQKNSGDNTGRLVPHIDWEIVEGESLELTVMPKGGGSENTSAFRALLPGRGLKALKKLVVDAVIKAGAKPCPPTVLGVAFGGGADVAMKIAKKALLRPLDKPNPDPELARLEEELLEAINMTGIGPMGLGGKTTALRVHVDYAFRHPASFPAAVAFNCWAARRASARIHPDGAIEYLTHRTEG